MRNHKNVKVHLECTGTRYQNAPGQKLERVEVLAYEIGGAFPKPFDTIWLTIAQAKLLMILGLRVGQVYKISSFDRGIAQNTIRQHISKINRILESNGLGRLIISTKRFEYRLAVESCNFHPLYVSAFESIYSDDQMLLDDHLIASLGVLAGIDESNCCPKCGCELE